MDSHLDLITEQQKRCMESLNTLASTLIHATDQVVRLNLAASQALCLDATSASKRLLDCKNAEETMAITGGFAQPAVERMVGYSRNAFGISSRTGAELYDLVQTQVAEGKQRLGELIELSLKNAPPGSEAAVSLLKHALMASNVAADAVASAAKKAAELAQSQLQDFSLPAPEGAVAPPASAS